MRKSFNQKAYDCAAPRTTPTPDFIEPEYECYPGLPIHTRENGYKAVKYEKLTALLIQALNEQQKEIKNLKTRIGWLEDHN